MSQDYFPLFIGSRWNDLAFNAPAEEAYRLLCQKGADRSPTISDSLAAAGWGILLLFLFNIVFFMGAFAAFMRYSV